MNIYQILNHIIQDQDRIARLAELLDEVRHFNSPLEPARQQLATQALVRFLNNQESIS